MVGFSFALQIELTKPFLGWVKDLSVQNSTDSSHQFVFDKPNSTQTFTTGYVRIDTQDKLHSE